MVDPMPVGAGRPVPPPRPLLRWLRQQADGRGGLQRGGRASGAGLHRQQGRAPQTRELRQVSTVRIKKSRYTSFPTYFTIRKAVNAHLFAKSKEFFKNHFANQACKLSPPEFEMLISGNYKHSS